MNLPPSDLLSEGLYYEASLPFAWLSLAEAPNGAQLAYWNTHNDTVLRGVAALEEHASLNLDEHGAQGHELARLEFKLNLLLDLVGQLLTQQLILPEAKWLRIGAMGVEWIGPQAPPAGTPLLLQLYLMPRYPQPLELAATVLGCETLPEGVRCSARFEGCSEHVQDGLEKLIFRQHRRSVAHTRGPKAP